MLYRLQLYCSTTAEQTWERSSIIKGRELTINVHYRGIFTKRFVLCCPHRVGTKWMALIIYCIVVSVIVPDPLSSKFSVLWITVWRSLLLLWHFRTAEFGWVWCAGCLLSGDTGDLKCASNNSVAVNVAVMALRYGRVRLSLVCQVFVIRRHWWLEMCIK